MNSKLRTLAVLALALLVAATAVPGTAEANPEKLDEIVAMNLEAKGGEEALREVDSVRIQGTMSMAGGQMTAPFTWEWKAPDKMRLEFTLQGMTAVQAYDGETGWMVMPFMGKTEPEKMPEAQAAEIEQQADFYGPFVDTGEKGYTLEYLGEEDVEGTPTYKVQVTDEDGDVTYLFLDKDYGLEIQSVSKRDVQGQEVEATTSIGDYKEVGSLVLAHSYDVSTPGSPMGTQTMTFESVELNPDLPDSHFEMPEVAAPADDATGDGGR